MAGVIGECIANFTAIVIDIYAVAVFLSFGTTSLTTFLMVYRMRSMWRDDPESSMKTRLYGVVELLVQSSAVYAIISFLYAISNIMVPVRPDQVSWFAMQEYTSTLFTTLSVCVFRKTGTHHCANVCLLKGMVPTIMVARIAITSFPSSSSNGFSTDRMSNIRFHANSIDAHPSRIMMDNIQTTDPLNGNPTPRIRGEKVLLEAVV